MSSSNPAPLSPFVRGVTDKNVYFLQGALRRLVPDAATLSFIAAGQPVRTLSDAALAAIKLGSPLPSRADGTLLSGKSQIAPPVKIVYLHEPRPAAAHPRRRDPHSPGDRQIGGTRCGPRGLVGYTRRAGPSDEARRRALP